MFSSDNIVKLFWSAKYNLLSAFSGYIRKSKDFALQGTSFWNSGLHINLCKLSTAYE